MLQVEEIELDKLIPWEGNPRLNEHAVDAVAESIRSFGVNVPILCDQNSTIIAGHTRWKAAQKLGLDRVPVIVVEMTDLSGGPSPLPTIRPPKSLIGISQS